MIDQFILVLVKVPSKALGSVSDLLNKLANPETSEDTLFTLKALLKGRVEIVKDKLLSFIGTVDIPETTDAFFGKKIFKKDSKEVRFYGFSNNFMNWFLKGEGLVEKPSIACKLRYTDITQDSLDDPIIEELGGKTEVRTTLSQIHSLLLKQPQGKKEGVLLTNGYANIFYVKDLEGELRAVYVLWRGGGWGVNAVSVEYPDGWYAGDRVFSSILEA